MDKLKKSNWGHGQPFLFWLLAEEILIGLFRVKDNMYGNLIKYETGAKVEELWSNSSHHRNSATTNYDVTNGKRIKFGYWIISVIKCILLFYRLLIALGWQGLLFGLNAFTNAIIINNQEKLENNYFIRHGCEYHRYNHFYVSVGEQNFKQKQNKLKTDSDQDFCWKKTRSVRTIQQNLVCLTNTHKKKCKFLAKWAPVKVIVYHEFKSTSWKEAGKVEVSR